MDFDPPVSVRPLLEKIEKFVADHVLPAEAEVMERGFTAASATLDRLRAQVKAAGMWAPNSPKDIGGLGLSLVEQLVTRAGGELRLCCGGEHASYGVASGVPCDHGPGMTVTVLLRAAPGSAIGAG
jgi:alkylation response protein AidB-like acyl-CoA dehydrogenase